MKPHIPQKRTNPIVSFRTISALSGSCLRKNKSSSQRTRKTPPKVS